MVLAGGGHGGGASNGLLAAPAKQKQGKRKGYVSMGGRKKMKNITLTCCFKWAF